MNYHDEHYNSELNFLKCFVYVIANKFELNVKVSTK